MASEGFGSFIHANLGLVSVFILAIVLYILFQRTYGSGGVKELSLTSATLKMKQKKSVILDIRTKDAFTQGHIAQSRWIDPKSESDQLTRLIKSTDSPVLVVCTSGIQAAVFARKIQKAGYVDVSTLKGGIQAWQKEGLPLVSGDSSSAQSASDSTDQPLSRKATSKNKSSDSAQFTESPKTSSTPQKLSRATRAKQAANSTSPL